ncbi:MAG: NAD(P)-dependent oxidoreductase [Chloroflexi bacterium]|nr:NAD(P)-dependent oxidoreductase [Chloroflexota bacterium]
MSTAQRRDVVILGNTGFIGRALEAHFAAQGIGVRGFSSASLDLRQRDNLAALDGCVTTGTSLVVTSATASGSAMTPTALAENVAMIANLAAYLGSHPAGLCVYLSSDALYPMQEEAVREDTPTDASSFYPLSKYAAERVLDYGARRSSTPLLVVRPTAVYGPGDTHNAYGPNRFARSLARERVVQLFGEGEETRDHIYIDDLVQAIAGLSLRGEGGLVNVATGTSVSFRAVAEALRRLADDDCQIVTTPRRNAVTHRRFDVSRLRAILPEWRPTPLEAGLEATLADARRTSTTDG